VLTVLSISFSLFLVLFLRTVLNVLMNPVVGDEMALRLIVRRSTSLADDMPFAYMEKIKKLPDVQYVIPLQWANGIYRDPKNFFANFATDPNLIWDVVPENKVTPEARNAFIAEKKAAVVGADLMKRFHWNVGDTITLTGTIFPVDLEFNIVGVYTNPARQSDFYFRYDYLNESLGSLNKIGAFYVRAKNAAAVPRVAEQIDALFRNSPAETKTETEKAFVLGFVSMLGNIQVIIGSVGIVVLFTMLLVSVSTMSMAVRERLREVAILRAIGFPRNTLLFLIVGEACLIAALGTALGIGMAESLRFVDLNRATQGFIERFSPHWDDYLVTVAAGALLGLVSGFVPAWQAVHTNIVEAMRSIE
jgi:putative ABC transport system permease protein